MNNYEYILIGDFELPYVSLLPDGHLLKIVLVNNMSEEALRSLDFSKFDSYNSFEIKMSTYEGYSTIYRYAGNVLWLSNDGSVYVEPKQHPYIKLNTGDPIDIKGLSVEGNILTISFIYSIDINRLIDNTITYYSITNDVIGRYVGFNTIYDVSGTTVQLSNDGSIHEKPRQYQYVKLDSGEIYDISDISADNHVVTITFVGNEIDIATKLINNTIAYYSSSNEKINEYVGFNTIYRINGKTVQLSNDESVYVEPRQYPYIMLNNNATIDVTEVYINGHILTIEFVENNDSMINRISKSKITYYSVTDQLIGEYTGFNTIFKVEGKTLFLSDDESVYVAPREHSYIKLDSGELIDVDSVTTDGNIISIILINKDDEVADKLISSILSYYSIDNEKLNEYNGYNTVYKIDGVIIQLSNDGSIYVEPKAYPYIKLDSEEIFDVIDLHVDDNILSIVFIDENVPTEKLIDSSIIYYSRLHEIIAQYDGFDTVYNSYGNTVQLSNDGTIYVPPREYQYIVINGDEYIDVSYVQGDGHVIMIAPIEDIDIADKLIGSNIVLYSKDDEKICEYNGFDTLYHIDGNVVYLSDDGTIYPRDYSFIVVDQGEIIDVTNVMIDGGILTISLVEDIDPELLIGDSIIYYAANRKKISEFNGFNTIYRVDGNNVQLSNDGTVYVEPKDYKYIQINHGDTINVYNFVYTDKYITVDCVNGSISFNDDIIGEDVTLYSEIDREIGKYYIYQVNGSNLSLSVDKPKQYQHISVDQIDDVDIISIREDGNLLIIECASEYENLAKNLIGKEITLYSTLDIETNKYSGYDTIYKTEGTIIYLSRDGSIAPRDNICIITSDKELIDVKKCSIYRNLIEIVLLNEEDNDVAEKLISGSFAIYNEFGMVLENYSEYTTIYRVNGATIQLSKDGSIYDPVVEQVRELEKAKEDKIESISDSCFYTINYGFFVEIRGEQKHFNFTTEDQQNIKTAFDLAFTTKMDVPYHADGEECKLYTPEEITNIYIAGQLHVTHHQTYYNQLKQYINSLDNIEDVERVQYGQELTGIYLNTYNTIMDQTQVIINAIVGVNQTM